MASESPTSTAVAEPVAESLQRSAIHYGWLMVPLASAAMVATLPGRTHGLGLVSSPLMSDLEIGPNTYAQMNLWATLIGALFCLPCGWMIDRFGLRSMVTLVLAGLATVVLGMSQVAALPLLFVLIMLSRGLGQSMLSIVSITMVGKWFTARWVGLAMGVYSVLLGLGFGVAFKTVGKSVLEHGWRDTWAGIGWWLLGVAAVSLLLVRDPPRRAAVQSTTDVLDQPSVSLREALATPCFWVFALASSFYGLFSSGIALFNQAILEELGFTAALYHNTLALGAVVGMAFNLLGGLLLAWIPLRAQLSAAMAVMAVALFLLPQARNETAVYANAVAMGAAGGLVTVVFFSVWARAFGKMHLGRIQALAQMLTVVASAVGPLAIAAAHEQTGSYLTAYQWFAPVAVAWAVAAALTPMPKSGRFQRRAADVRR
ncbi:MAG TPA: MFS transporter [Pirellulales bacterium]|jgi:MFS family permease|nr:MFS transporter [Pirellulales bacterium]